MQKDKELKMRMIFDLLCTSQHETHFIFVKLYFSMDPRTWHARGGQNIMATN